MPSLTPHSGPGGIRTLVQQFLLGHAEISLKKRRDFSKINRNGSVSPLVVDAVMIGHRTLFKAILSHFDAFSDISWVANPL